MTNMTFTISGLLRGAKRCIPLAIGVFAYGLVFGVLARQAGLSLLESVLMSGMVFAGASQLVAMELWTTPLPVLTIVLTTLVINLRHLLMGAALRPWFADLPPLKAYGSVFLMADENWALSVREFAEGERDAAFLAGSGLAIFIAWLSATCVGQAAGAAVGDPAGWGLDFAFTAVFVALLVSMWSGKSSLLPWAAAAMAAVVASRLLPGKWYILLGGVVGSIVGAWRDAD